MKIPVVTASRRLVDVASDAGRVGLQSLGTGRSGQRGRPAHGVVARAVGG